MVFRFTVSVSVVSVASVVALWTACSKHDDYMVPPGAVAADAHTFRDAHEYMDAREFHDAHVFMDALIPRSCTNHANPVMMGSGASETETLIVIFDCGSYGPTGAGTATPTMIDGSGARTVLPPYNFQCGNNVMTFNTQVTLTADELTAAGFDIFCAAAM